MFDYETRRWRALDWVGLLVPLALLHASTARADIGDVESPANLWTQWSWDPVVLAGFMFASVVYGRGIRRLWRAAGKNRGVSRRRVACFYSGLGVLFLALVSPLDALGAALFSAHMVQHLVLMALAAPLVVLGRPIVAVAWSVPNRHRARVCRAYHWRPVRWTIVVLRRPLPALALHTVALWVWHMPGPYEAALKSEPVHWLEHASFLGTSILLWGVLLGASCSAGLRILYLFASATQGAVLGALLTVAPTPWYTVHATGARAWGVDLLADQQLAGLIMWIPGGVVYAIAALASFFAWLRQAQRSVHRREVMRGASWRAARASAPLYGARTMPKRREIMQRSTIAGSVALWLCSGPMIACEPARGRPPARQVPGGDEDHGRLALASHGCGSCHIIPGVDGAVGLAAGPLDHFAERAFVAGVLPNNADNLVRWIVDPQAVNERTAMPNLGVTESHARDMAAYLYTLRAD